MLNRFLPSSVSRLCLEQEAVHRWIVRSRRARGSISLVALAVISGWALGNPAAAAKTAAPPSPPADRCASITKGVQSRIETMKTLKAKADKEDASAPNSVSGALDGVAGTKSVRQDALDKLAIERRTVEQLNAMLSAVGCKAIDIDAELAKPPNPSAQAPDAHTKSAKHKKKG